MTANTPRQPSTVFLVEDEELLRGVTKRLLEKRGFIVLQAGSAEEALGVFEAHDGSVDALLMDINLPDGWGSVLAQRLKALQPDMAVVYTTGFADSDPILAAALADAEYVVRKPYTGDQVAEILQRAIAER